MRLYCEFLTFCVVFDTHRDFLSSRNQINVVSDQQPQLMFSKLSEAALFFILLDKTYLIFSKIKTPIRSQLKSMKCNYYY